MDRQGILKGTIMLLATLMLVQSLWAATSTTTLPISANVLSVCIGLTASSLAFGNYDPTSGSPTDGFNSMAIQCTLNNSYTIALDQGTTTGGTVALRKMQNGVNTLDYTLYTTSDRSTIWGNGSSGTSTVAGTGTGLAQNYTIYGRIPARQASPAGSYSDTITITVTY